MDSQAPNAAAKEWLLSGGFGEIEALRAETVHGDSRFDFSFFRDGKLWFLEVKGVTLEENGVCAFPDAPIRARSICGVRPTPPLKGMARASVRHSNGGRKIPAPQRRHRPGFWRRLRDAAGNGVHILAMDCAVTEQSMTIRSPVEVRL